jgi:hypothetical protein
LTRKTFKFINHGFPHWATDKNASEKIKIEDKKTNLQLRAVSSDSQTVVAAH